MINSMTSCLMSFNSLHGRPLRGLSNKALAPPAFQSFSYVAAVCLQTPKTFDNSLRLNPVLLNKTACARIRGAWLEWCLFIFSSISLSSAERFVTVSIVNDRNDLVMNSLTGLFFVKRLLSNYLPSLINMLKYKLSKIS